MKPSILFMGTPDFAVVPISALLRDNYRILGVVTQPDRPQGRGRKISESPVKKIALEHQLPVFQPHRVRDESFREVLSQLSPDLIVVAAFGQILPPFVLRAAPLGCINIHPSLLPKYRGAAPINRAIIQGETITGTTIMLLDEGMDSGDVLWQVETPILASDTYGSLHDRLSQQGAEALLATIPLLTQGLLSRQPQDHHLATFAPRISKEDCLINWHSGVISVANLIRGLSPLPAARTFLQGEQIKIIHAEVRLAHPLEPPGSLVFSSDGIMVAAMDGYVSLQTIQRENRSVMSVGEFRRGFRPAAGTRFDGHVKSPDAALR